MLALRDKSPDAPGKIKLFMTTKPQVELKEWLTTDAQGIDTRVELSELTKRERRGRQPVQDRGRQSE